MTNNNRIILCNNRHHSSEADFCVKGNNSTWRTKHKFCNNSKDQQEYVLSGGTKSVLNFNFSHFTWVLGRPVIFLSSCLEASPRAVLESRFIIVVQ